MNADGRGSGRLSERATMWLLVAAVITIVVILGWILSNSHDDDDELRRHIGDEQHSTASRERRDAARGNDAKSVIITVVDHLTGETLEGATVNLSEEATAEEYTAKSRLFTAIAHGKADGNALLPSDLRVTMDDERGRRELAVMGIDRPDESTFRVRAAATARITFAIEDARSSTRPTVITVVSLPEIPPIDASESPIWKRSHATLEALRNARFRDYRRILSSARLLDAATDFETEFEIAARVEEHRLDLTRSMELGIIAAPDEACHSVAVLASAGLGHETRIEIPFVPWPVVEGRIIDAEGHPVANRKVEVRVAARVANDDMTTWPKIQTRRGGFSTVAGLGAPDAVVSTVRSGETDSEGRFRVPVPFTANVAVVALGDEQGRGIDYRHVSGTFEPVLDVEVLLRRISVDRIRVVNSAGAPVTKRAFRIETERTFLPKVETAAILTDEQGFIDTTMLTRGMTYDLCTSPGKSIARFVCSDGEVVVVDP